MKSLVLCITLLLFFSHLSIAQSSFINVIDFDGDGDYAATVNETIFPIGSGVNGIVTLTSSATAYAIPTTASTKNHNIILYNGSDTTIFIGYQNTNANGIPILAGKTMEFKLGINQQLYGYCASSGKIMTYSYKELT